MFLNAEGKPINQEDFNVLKNVWIEIFDSYKESLEDLAQMMPNTDFYKMIFSKMAVSKRVFMANFEEGFASNKEIKLDAFMDSEIKKYYEAVSLVADKKFFMYSDFKKNFIDDFQGKIEKTSVKDTPEGLYNSMKSFKLTDKAFPGVENIESYNPKTDNEDVLMEVRKGNSNTYDVAQNADPEIANAINNSYKESLIVVNTQASKLMDKDTVAFSDLLETFKAINRSVRKNDPQGGKLRGENVSFGDKNAIAPAAIPGHLFTTLSKIAEYINTIKKTKDPNVQKSQAIQLSAFTYSMLISEHVFTDGNGRTCRMFADTMLQTFGLPSHTPNVALMSAGGEIGTEFDFNRGARQFFEGVRQSDELIKLGKVEQEEGLENQAQSYLADAKLPQDILNHVSPRRAIGMAVQAKENVFSFAEALDDFVKADHFGTWNSDQYKNLIEKAKEVKEVLLNEPYTSAKVKKEFKEFREVIAAYEAHCKKHPKNNPTRRARLDAAFDFGRSMFYIEHQAQQIGKMQAKDITDNQLPGIKTDILETYSKPETKKEGIAKFIIFNVANAELKKYEGQFTEDTKYKTIDEIQHAFQMTPKMVSGIMNSPLFEQTINDLNNNPEFAGKSPEEQLMSISKEFVKREKKALQDKIKEKAQEKVGSKSKAKKNEKVKEEPKEPQSLSFFG